MVKALKLREDFYVNINNIVTLVLDESSIQISTNGSVYEIIQVAIDVNNNYGDVLVSVQEFHRIKRELFDSMGIKE
ncbi:hypothetical protein [Aliivibrio sp. 1S128]|uniref:hypothetical protein n=1 Tax=Aliivibrio sp. 1S128 TaxID=1840085 RepID=UPI00080D90FD|nr:hypothetical protein [Aliivibrio sp. 1S128]OCH12317.1 hypothetical protein A6E03_18810 [Aliivibrio sp. 1S128]